ncbi:MAG: type II toxin-antitoxin system Phd/YefM family antitoxin [Acidobacteriota bacterium]
MKTATLTETKNGLSSLIDQVRQGEEILILDRGRPVARLISAVTDDSSSSQGRIERLERLGVLRRPSSPNARGAAPKARSQARRGGSILQALLDERSSTR